MLLLALVYVFVIFLSGIISASPITSKFDVVLPKLFSKSLKPSFHSFALFDVLDSPSSSVFGSITYAPLKNCEINFDKLREIEKPAFLLIQAEDCEKGRLTQDAQRNGIQGVLFWDDICHCPVSSGFTEECNKIGKLSSSPRLNVDGQYCDGSPMPRIVSKYFNSFIRIPAILLDWETSRRIYDCLFSVESSGCAPNTVVIATFRWNIPTTPVPFGIWSSSDSGWQAKKMFAQLAPKLEGYVSYQPRFMIYSASEWGCSTTPMCAIHCSKNLYCNSGSMTVTGKQIVEEDLRQLCIFEQASKTSTVGKAYWEYLLLFMSSCVDMHDISQKCSESVLKQIKSIQLDVFNTCMTSSWKAPKLNWMLENQIQIRQEVDISSTPVLEVSGFIVRNPNIGISVKSMIHLICEHSLLRPSVCQCVFDFGDVAVCIQSQCGKDERYCETNKQCYPSNDFVQQCKSVACPEENTYCESLEMCIAQPVRCPPCPDTDKPFYCIITKTCLDSSFTCSILSQNFTVIVDYAPPAVGSNASEVVSITLVLLGIISLLLYTFWWKDHRKHFREEVVDILSTYRPLDESNRLNTTRRNNAQVEPDNGEQEL